MTSWTSDELNRIEETDELRLASMRRDGSMRKPVTIWVVRVVDDLYVRAVKGPSGPWFRGTRARREGRIWAGGVEKDVSFVDAGGDINEQVDAEYRAKYERYPDKLVDTVMTPEARSTTIKLMPRSAGS